MNSSIRSLTLNNLYSAPFFSNKKSISLINSKISKSFNTFTYNIYNLKVIKTSFSYFQESVLKFESKLYEFTGLHKAHLSIPSYGQDIFVEDAFFLGCVATLDGGAINHFSPDEGNLKVKRSTFLECRGSKYPGDGGAIYFSGNTSEIVQCCASKCLNYRDGHFICIALRGELPTNNHFNSSTVTFCGFKNPNGWQTSYLSVGLISEIGRAHV